MRNLEESAKISADEIVAQKRMDKFHADTKLQLLQMAKAGKQRPQPFSKGNSTSDEAIHQKRLATYNADLQQQLLDMAKAGKPKPKPGTILGDALIAFTTA